jgi:Flp pilus assembly protein TadG
MKCRSATRGSKGQAQVEFALTVVFVMVLVLGCIEMMVLIYTYSVLADAAKEGVRYAVVHGAGVGAANCSGPGGAVPGGATVTCADATANNVITKVTNYTSFSFHDSSAMTITPTYLDTSSVAPSRVRVTVSYPYQAIFGLGWPTVTLNAAAEGRIVF